MSNADNATDENRPTCEERIARLEERVQQLTEQLDQQYSGSGPPVTRRQTLGLIGGGALLGVTGTASAQPSRGRNDIPYLEEENHDHSGEYLGKGTPITHTDTTHLHTRDLSNVKIVGPHGYESIQAAHDDLPSAGGQIRLTKSVTETDIVFTKYTRFVGGGAGLASGNHGTRIPKIDTSGGNGIHVKSPDCTIRDVLIDGDRTGGYGLKLGVEGKYTGRFTVDNVAVHEKGGHGIVVVGAQLNDRLDINARNCAGDGWHFDVEWFNENLIHRFGANRCDGKGIHIEGGSFMGNTAQQLWAEDNEDWGLYVEDGTIFAGNSISGYGIEQGDSPVMYIPSVDPDIEGYEYGGNVLHVNSLAFGDGEVDIDEAEFGSIIIGRKKTQKTGSIGE